MDTRSELGKVHRKGMDIAMEVVAVNIPISDGGNTAAQSLHNKEARSISWKGRTKDKLSTDVSCPYYKVTEKYQEMRIWTPGAPPIIRGNRAGTTIECKDYILEVPGGGELPSRILSLITELGRARMREYFIKYYINNYGEVKKLDKIVDLSRINLTVDGIKEKLSQQLILHTSTTAKDFDKIMFTKAKLWEQYSDMYLEKRKSENHRVDINDPLPKIGANKTCIMGFLVKWRRQVFKKNPTLEHELAERVKADFASKGLSTNKKHAELLEDKLFRLTE